MKIKENNEVKPKLIRRRVPRLILHFPVQIEVIARDGLPRRIEARTTEVSRYGATLECKESISVDVAVNLTLPFGGPFMAQVNGVWVEEETADYRLSVKLIDPPEWTSPTIAFSQTQPDDSTQMMLEPRTYYLLTAYQTYLQETAKQKQSLTEITHLMVKKALRFDMSFQKWMTQKIMEDLQSWEGERILNLASVRSSQTDEEETTNTPE